MAELPPPPSMPRLPAEIVAYIIELAILTCSPCPRTAVLPASSSEAAKKSVSPLLPSPFNTPLRSSYTSAWSWTGELLYVSRFVHSIARPLLLRTLTLDTERAVRSFFHSVDERDATWGEKAKRAWFGNVSVLARDGVLFDPLALRLDEAAWYEECSGGFVVGHAYASREKEKGRERRGKERPRQYRSVSVYWAEEELVEEVSDPDRSSGSSEEESDGTDSEGQTQETNGYAQSLPLSSTYFGQQQHQEHQDIGEGVSQRRSSHQEGSPARSSRRDARMDKLYEPTWQAIYSRRRRPSPLRRAQEAASSSGGASSPIGPSEGDLDPWDMQDAQERLTALANAIESSTDTHEADHDTAESNAASPVETASTLPIAEPLDPFTAPARAPLHRNREIYAYHLCTATLEAWINPHLASIRTLRLITLTFYPGHLLDDDKLEHMLRRILSPSECPRLQTLLIRIVFDAASAGSRMRRFERTKTIAGAADRIGDERVRVMLVHNRAGEGELVVSGNGDEGAWSAGSRKAIGLTKEGWWSRVLQRNHHQALGEDGGREAQERRDAVSGDASKQEVQAIDERQEQERRLSDWSMFFPPSQHANPTQLVNLLHHCDPWPDCSKPVT